VLCVGGREDLWFRRRATPRETLRTKEVSEKTMRRKRKRGASLEILTSEASPDEISGKSEVWRSRKTLPLPRLIALKAPQ
jgi:hypothetical protein